MWETLIPLLATFLLSGGATDLINQFDANPSNNPGLQDWLLPLLAGGAAGVGGFAAGKAIHSGSPEMSANSVNSNVGTRANGLPPPTGSASGLDGAGIFHTVNPTYNVTAGSNALDFQTPTGVGNNYLPQGAFNFGYQPPPLAGMPPVAPPPTMNNVTPAQIQSFLGR